MYDERRRWMLGALAAALGGCAAPPSPAPARKAMVWPLPPEQPRYIYEATLRNGKSIRDESDLSQMRRLVTGEDDSRSTFGKPLAVAARAGRIYVSDTEGRRIFVFDVPRRRTFSFGYRREGELKKPGGLAIDEKGRVYVVDTTARRLVVFDALGLYLGEIDGAKDWVRPTAVAVTPDAERLYVVDTGGVGSEAHCLWSYRDQGKALGRLGRRGGGPGEFNLPADAAFGPDGTLWVLDAGNFRVQAFDGQGRYLRHFGAVGNGLGMFARPRGLAVDRDGMVYVSDAVFCNIQVFQPDGQLLIALGGRAEKDTPGRYMLPAKICTDEGNRLYVVDQFLHKIDVLRRLTDAEGIRLMAEANG